MTGPLAALDAGSNTIRLLVGTVKDGAVTTLLDDSDFVRMGSGVDKTGRLAPDRIEAGLQAIKRLVDEAHECGVKTIDAIATSAIRDATNGNEFIERVKQETGLEVRIISGEREADLTFQGAIIGVELAGGVLVCDLGGGSAELISAGESGIRWRTSVPLGSGRLTERFIQHDPPERHEIAQLEKYVTAELKKLQQATPRSLVFTGGTATHIAYVAGSTETMTHLEGEKLREVVNQITSLSAAGIVDRYDFRPERAKVLAAGAATLEAIAAHYQPEGIIITRNGLREGMLLDSVQSEGQEGRRGAS